MPCVFACCSITCNLASAEQLVDAVASCTALPPSCDGYGPAVLPPFTVPTDCTSPLPPPPADCDLSPGACPDTPCQLLCSISHV